MEAEPVEPLSPDASPEAPVEKPCPMPYSSYASSQIITFIVGQASERFFLPADLVAQLSPKLHALVHNGFMESTDAVVDWKNEDREVFFRFGDFAFKDEYQVHRTHALPPLEDGLSKYPARALEIVAEGIEMKRLREKKEMDGKLINARQKRLEKLESNAERREQQNAAWWAEEAGGTEPGNSGLAHARIYVFADYHGIDRLKDLGLEALRRLLQASDMCDSIRGRFVELVRYALENTVDPEVKVDPLREMVVSYCDLWYDFLMDKEDFQELLSQGLAVPLMNKIRPVKSYHEIRTALKEATQSEKERNTELMESWGVRESEMVGG